ncbi:DUF418 domain-containing protein [Nocardiopsis valliformis]|uniref:DUF418 domain-containing protein n=1 Tax=Nocardiopsis valliformis TaxID=239974 RepID=UPI000347A75D|nr:DUF418 domain-containing protein [Nocardiopsis valliformis]
MPDLARGFMLLFIALANVSWYLYGAPTSSVAAHPTDAEGLDALWQTAAMVAVDGRSYPLFAFLFGYGIWQAYSRHRVLGHDVGAVRGTLQARHLWMILFGAAHAALLWHGDVLGAYGLIGLLTVWLFIERSDRTLAVWVVVLGALLGVLAAVSLLWGAVFAEWSGGTGEALVPEFAAITSYSESILPRLLTWLLLTVGQGVLGLVVPVAVLVAVLCARHRVLEAPERHRPLLAAVAFGGISVGWLGALPSVLVHHGMWDAPEWSPAVFNGFTGLFAGFGYVSLIALLVSRRAAAKPPGRILAGISAMGRRSLSCYLFQSVAFAPLLCAWGLGLGGVLTQWQAALLAVAVWAVSLVLAVLSERSGRPGPAESLLRTVSGRGRTGTRAPRAT